jgi:predicted protein tyrosine phosphatase
MPIFETVGSGMSTRRSPLLPYRVSVCGLNELSAFATAGVSHVVSILDPDWPDPSVFAGYPPHSRITYRFDDVIEVMDGFAAPGAAEVETLLALGERLTGEPVVHLLVHCHAGVSRSTAAAAILMAQHNSGREDEVFARIQEIRPRSWPNSRLVALADVLLGRQGALSAALRRHLERTTQAYPELAQLLRLHGRAHEVPELIAPGVAG